MHELQRNWELQRLPVQCKRGQTGMTRRAEVAATRKRVRNDPHCYFCHCALTLIDLQCMRCGETYVFGDPNSEAEIEKGNANETIRSKANNHAGDATGSS